MADLAMPWGAETLNVSLPNSWQIEQVAEPSLRPAGEDWQQRLARGINQPDSGLPLGELLTARRGGRVVLVVEDVTRHSPLPEILDVVLREVRHAGFDDEHVELFFAGGMHSPMTHDQVEAKVGQAAAAIPWRFNPWRRGEQYQQIGRVDKVDVAIDRGVADADLRIVISSVSPHLQAGFGGGYKMLLPGCAALETIRGLHRLGLGKQLRQLVGMDGSANPMRRVIDAAGAMIDERHGRSFAVQYVLDGQDKPSFLGAGEMRPTQQMLAKQCAVACGVLIGQPADIVVTNAHPRDNDLWQSFKAIAHACWAARENGAIVAFSRCPDGAAMPVPPWPIGPKWTRRIVRALGAETLSALLPRAVPSLASDAAFFIHIALQTLHRNAIFLVSPTLAQNKRGFPGLHIFAEAGPALEAAAAHVATDKPRVIVFPSGGITYPLPPERRP